MPELPEVETMRRGIASVIGETIAEVQLVASNFRPIGLSPRPSLFVRRLADRTIRDTGRLGKRVILHLDNDDAIVVEPRMTGLVLLTDPPDYEHLRLGIGFRRKAAPRLWYWDRRGLGSVRLLTSKELEQKVAASLGPDALAITQAELRDRLQRSRRAIKVALLDQALIAGIGNLYAAEILHLARIHPANPCSQLINSQWHRLHGAIGEVLHKAIQCEGSTLSDGTYRNALNKQGGYQNHHRVYARAGEQCPTCQRGTIERTVQAQRATFSCPVCQRKRKK
jgi:formamidopyrimidine-DNA glycosylase